MVAGTLGRETKKSPLSGAGRELVGVTPASRLRFGLGCKRRADTVGRLVIELVERIAVEAGDGFPRTADADCHQYTPALTAVHDVETVAGIVAVGVLRPQHTLVHMLDGELHVGATHAGHLVTPVCDGAIITQPLRLARAVLQLPLQTLGFGDDAGRLAFAHG